jgi:hypothetical protein
VFETSQAQVASQPCAAVIVESSDVPAFDKNLRPVSQSRR